MNWTALDNELPPIDFKVLLCDKNNYISIGVRDKYGNYYSEENCILTEILFWQHLPLLPGMD
jgi:hypothetical protein